MFSSESMDSCTAISTGLSITLKQTPKAQPRARSRICKGFVMHYDPAMQEKQKDQEELVTLCSEIGWSKTSEPVSVQIHACYPHPVSWTHKKKAFMSKARKASKPDVDNIAKYYLDIMTGVVWEDDCQVTELFIFKQYESYESPGAFVTLKVHILAS
jgi:Holliday junction resolvase RusA-like endonuclease